ncbi:G-protein coupled receptor 4-like [Petromyzon marinus]|uniref:G-protein coupled receptor 4-like n=1 Tax=Petromyzon marinus TaxID=7757 RepID=UPI003F7066DB
MQVPATHGGHAATAAASTAATVAAVVATTLGVVANGTDASGCPEETFEAALENGTLPDCGADLSAAAVLLPVVHSLVFALGLPGNAAALWLSAWHARRGNVLAVYLLGLSASDLLYVAALPLWIEHAARRRLRWAWGDAACRAAAFLLDATNSAAALFLCCVAVDRYLAVAHPLRSRPLRRVRVARAVSAGAWAAAVAEHAPALAHPAVSRAHAACLDRFPLERWAAGAGLAVASVGFLLPLAGTAAAYAGAVRAVRRCPAVGRRRGRRVRRVAVAVVLISALSFGPFYAALLVRAAARLALGPCAACRLDARVAPAYEAAFALTAVNSALDPVLNALAVPSAREPLARALAPLAGWCVEEESAPAPLSSDTEMVAGIRLPGDGCSEDVLSMSE